MEISSFYVVLLSLGSLVLSQGCTDLGELDHGYRQYNYDSGQKEVTYGCKENYSLDGSDRQVCTSDNVWEPAEKPICRLVRVSSIKCPLPTIRHGKVIDRSSWESSHWKEVEVVCDMGYKLSGNYLLVCDEGGTWANTRDDTDFPTCIRDSGKSCLPVSMSRIPHANIVYSRSQPYLERTRATVNCQIGYRADSTSHSSLTCIAGGWQGIEPKCVPYLTPPRTKCSRPPEIPFATVEQDFYHEGVYVEGSKVIYRCHKGYSMEDEAVTMLVCHDRQWPGKLPTCALTILCDSPESIPDGDWMRVERSHPYTYEVGTKIRYECKEGYKLLGVSLIWCQEGKTWSHTPPQCVPNSDESIYCSSPEDLLHGVCTCQRRGKSYCEPFTPGMRWFCHCMEGYSRDGAEVLTCEATGQWNHDMPSCLPMGDQISSAMDSSTVKESSHISTLAIVVATACSVLGVLLLVMVAVIFRRHKPRPRMYHTTPVPPPYTRVDSNSAEEHDRVALIAYAEGRHIALPSYEEAMRGPQRSLASVGSMNPGVGGEAGPHGSQYRPLPPVPPMLRANPQTNPQMSGDNNNRHSTATTASTVHTNRDGFSDVFGSMDTVNVSISDASTSGTVETVDSGASNPSLASRRANAGSLGSSNGSLANDDTRLIETSGDGRIMSTSSEPLPEEDKEE